MLKPVIKAWRWGNGAQSDFSPNRQAAKEAFRHFEHVLPGLPHLVFTLI